MKISTLSLLVLLIGFNLTAQEFRVTDVYVTKDNKLEHVVFSMEVEGIAGDSLPTAIGKLDGAPVLGYVFPTSLKSSDVGFDATEGIVALALTSHPDFDDTPLWDENNDADYLNDGVVWHPHWVLLEANASVPGGLAVKATVKESVLPPTNPGMPMYMDSPGFQVTLKNHTIECVVPYSRLNHRLDFAYDGVAAYMQVNTTDPNLPMLGVYKVYSVASGDLSLPYTVGVHSCDTLVINVSSTVGKGLVSPESVLVYPNPAQNEVTIESLVSHTDDLEVQIFDLNGTITYQKELKTGKLTVPTGEIGAKGTYVLKIIDTSSGTIKGTKSLILLE